MNTSTAEHAAVLPEEFAAPPVDPAAVAPPQTRRWVDVPLGQKLTLLVSLTAVAGAGVGFAAATMGLPAFAMLAALGLAVIALVAAGLEWVVAPVQRLAERVERVSLETRPPGLRSLPLDRMDEVGRLARAVQTLQTWSMRDAWEARRLRRTLDQQVQQATQQATKQLQRLAMRDPLTDLGNRRFLDEHLEPLVAAALDAKAELMCLAIDVDNFKAVNDTLGHAIGDELLGFLANLIHASVRHGDVAVRIGGDEFVVLIPGCLAARAAALANQLIALFRQHVKATLPAACTASLSIGVASLLAEGVRTGRELLERADAQLYAAKRGGKNQVAGV